MISDIFESYNGFGVSDELGDTIPGVLISVQKTFFVCSNFSLCTLRSFMFLVLYFDKPDLSMNLFVGLQDSVFHAL